jgi:hypothetical protein
MREAAAELRTEAPLEAGDFAQLRRKTMLEGCKWDVQVGDVTALAPFPLVMKRSVWRQLARQAEKLDAEAVAAEEEISRRPDLLHRLGLPRALRKALAADEPLTPAAGRVVRFDFHLTTEGWRISEGNSDVPGGFSEASHFTGFMAGHFPHLMPAGDPAAAWCGALAASAAGGPVALLSAPGLMEDHQVVAFLAAGLNARGCATHLAKPEQVFWHAGQAHLRTQWYRGPLAAVVRFYQAEWLPRFAAHPGWQHFFRGGKTPVANPPLGILSESKRFPLLWNDLATPLPTWRALLPAACDPRARPWFDDPGWLLKTAYCNTGEAVCIRHLLTPWPWWQVKLQARLAPGGWVAQRCFESVPVPTPLGPRHVCVGIYTVNGKAAGAYARLAGKPLIDHTAVDVALLLDPHE